MPHESQRRARANLRESDAVLNDIPLPLFRGDGPQQPIREELTNIFSQPIRQGDPRPVDDPMDSIWAVSSWIGGGQKKFGNPASSIERFDWGEVMSEYVESLTLPLLVRSYDRPAGFADVDPVMLGDFPVQDSIMLAAWNADIGKWDEATKAWTDTGHNLPAVATKEGTPYTLYATGAAGAAGTTLLFVPHGTSYSYYGGSADATNVPGQSAIAFSVWNEQIFRLGADGTIDWSHDGVIWNGLVTRIPDGSKPRNLVYYLDAQSNPVLYVVTDSGIFVLDYDGRRLVRPSVFFPRHPHNGTASAVWRDALYLSTGIGAHSYIPGNFTPVGMDRDQSLPVQFRGFIRHFVGGYNGLFALVGGFDVAGGEETAEMPIGGGDSGPLYGSAVTANVLLMMYNTFGWHFRWKGINMTSTNVYISQAQGVNRIWWGAGSKARTQILPLAYYNPADSPDFEYEEEGFLETSWWDYGWKGQRKLGKTIELDVINMNDDGLDSVTVSVKFDKDSNTFLPLGTITTNGEHHFHLGLNEHLTETYGIDIGGDPDLMLYEGVMHERIKLKFELRRKAGNDNTTRHPIITWHKATARRMLRPIQVWRIAADLTKVKYKNYTVGQMIDHIKLMVTGEQGHPVVVPFVPYNDDRVYMVEVTSVSFDRAPGDMRAVARITLIESKSKVT